jgi:hypothetical protein
MLSAMGAMGGKVGACALDATDGGVGGGSDGGAPSAHPVGNHPGRFEGRGFLVPWTPWRDALGREMEFYSGCAPVGNYPVFAVTSHVGGDCMPAADDAIPAMQDGVGMLSYLQYWAWTQKQDPRWLATARALGDYLIDQSLTPADGKYPRFPRSTGKAAATPQPADCGTEEDMPYEIEPDKGGLAGYALLQLAAATGENRYRDVALAIAQVLAANQTKGDATHTPWPFRADYRTGAPRGDVSGNLSYILRLYDGLIAQGHDELRGPRDDLWSFVVTYQIPNAACGDGQLWAQFFEDMGLERNRTAWAPLSLARYLLEQKEAIDPAWRDHVGALLHFVSVKFVEQSGAWLVCTEQDDDRIPYGGILSTWGAVEARYAKETGDERARVRAYTALNLLIYSIDDNGCPSKEALLDGCGGWIQDTHLDVIHNFMDAVDQFPEWAE